MKVPGGNMNQLMKQAKKLQDKMAQLEEELKEKRSRSTPTFWIQTTLRCCKISLWPR